jgi:hypothetical protein
MTTYIKALCHCGLNEFSIPFKSSALPIVKNICHCSSCRFVSGQLAVNHVPFDGEPIKGRPPRNEAEGQYSATCDSDLQGLTRYNTSSAARYFCSTCGATMLWYDEEFKWCVAIGTLERTAGVVEVGWHIWLEDTKDGGLADFLPKYRNVELPRFARGFGSLQLPLRWRNDRSTPQNENDTVYQSLALEARCHCGGVAFSITHPNSVSAKTKSLRPDIVASSPFPAGNLAAETWPLDDKDKYLATICACTSCRLASGFETQAWAFVPRTNIIAQDSEAIGFSTNRPTSLQTYQSSGGVYRDFCSRCGATAFCRKEGQPGSIQVSVGLLRAPDGARAETWLSWRKARIGFIEDALNTDLFQGLEEGIKGWGTMETATSLEA